MRGILLLIPGCLPVNDNTNLHIRCQTTAASRDNHCVGAALVNETEVKPNWQIYCWCAHLHDVSFEFSSKEVLHAMYIDYLISRGRHIHAQLAQTLQRR